MHLQCIDNLVARLVDNPVSSRMEPGITESVSSSRRVTRTRKLINKGVTQKPKEIEGNSSASTVTHSETLTKECNYKAHYPTATACQETLGPRFEAERLHNPCYRNLGYPSIHYNNHRHWNPFPYQVETRSQNLSAKESCLETRSQNLSAKASCPLSLTVTVLILHYKIASMCGCKRCQLKLSTGGQNAKNY